LPTPIDRGTHAAPEDILRRTPLLASAIFLLFSLGCSVDGLGLPVSASDSLGASSTWSFSETPGSGDCHLGDYTTGAQIDATAGSAFTVTINDIAADGGRQQFSCTLSHPVDFTCAPASSSSNGVTITWDVEGTFSSDFGYTTGTATMDVSGSSGSCAQSLTYDLDAQ